MAAHMVHADDRRDAVLFYSNKRRDEIAYMDVFERAAEKGLRTVYATTDDAVPGMHHGFIDADLIAREVPDYRERTFYISGPHGMVEAFKKTLRDMGVPRRQIKIDFFPGFA